MAVSTEYLSSQEKELLVRAREELKKKGLHPDWYKAARAIRDDLLQKAKARKDRMDLIRSAPPARPFYRSRTMRVR